MTTTPTPRPVPTTEDRMAGARNDRTFATYLDRTERDQLDARAATAEQERDEALDELRDTRTDRKHKTEVLIATARALDMLPGDRIDDTPAVASRLRAERDEARRDRDDYREARDVLRHQLDAMTQAALDHRKTASDALAEKYAALGEAKRARAELGAAQELIAVLDDATERIDRARAAYATRPSEGSVTITLDNSAGTFTPRHPGDALADALRNAYTTGQLGLLHEHLVEQVHEATEREDPLGRLVDALFAARHKPTTPALGSPSPRAQDQPVRSETDVPDWVLMLIRGLAKYEAEHPKLFRYGNDADAAPCPCSLLEGVPAAVRAQAEREG